MGTAVKERQREFNRAMERFGNSRVYDNGPFFSAAIVLLQVYAVFHIVRAPVGLLAHVATFVAALYMTDLWNGFLHLVLDNATGYRSAVGPFVANFQMHHRYSGYGRAHPARVYWVETGDKKWLLPFLVLVLWMEPGPIQLVLLEIGVLSSVAEVAHYWSHATDPDPFVRRLQRIGLLIEPAEHRIHHERDNTHYAFFTGWANPVLNRLASAVAPGYENRTDRYAESYDGEMGKRK